MPAQVEVLLFAIRSAIRINEQVRRGFADLVRADEIHLPLPNFPSSPTVESARTFYEAEGAEYLKGDAKLRGLYERWQALNETDTQQFLRYYQEHWALHESNAVPAGSTLQADLGWDDYRALLTVRQWRRGAETTPSLLQRAAGTLIEIAVDYELEVPGVVNTATPQGKLVKAFLEAIEQINFAEGTKATISARLVDSLFVSVLDTLRDHPEIAADGERGQLLVRTVSLDLAKKAQALVEKAPDQLERDRVHAFTKALFPSLLKPAAAAVIGDPQRFLGLGRPEEIALVSEVGKALLEASGDGELAFEKIFSPGPWMRWSRRHS